jgi:membrane-associated phospholipid phosphatase
MWIAAPEKSLRSPTSGRTARVRRRHLGTGTSSWSPTFARPTSARSAPLAFALLSMALHDAAVGCWDTKYFYFNPRPSQMDPELKTVIGLPNFPSYTSGHSTFSGTAAEVLSYLFPADASFFDAQKEEASISRLYGGIHYRSDLEMGKAHGKRIGGYTVSFARTDGADLP